MVAKKKAPKEKINEVLISEDEARRTRIFDSLFAILPQFYERREVHKKYDEYQSLEDGFAYRSDNNDRWLTVEELQDIVEAYGRRTLEAKVTA